MTDKTNNINELKQQNYISMKKLKEEINKLKDKFKDVKHQKSKIRGTRFIVE